MDSPTLFSIQLGLPSLTLLSPKHNSLQLVPNKQVTGFSSQTVCSTGCRVCGNMHIWPIVVVVDINVLPDILKCGNVCPNRLSNMVLCVCICVRFEAVPIGFPPLPPRWQRMPPSPSSLYCLSFKVSPWLTSSINFLDDLHLLCSVLVS